MSAPACPRSIGYRNNPDDAMQALLARLSAFTANEVIESPRSAFTWKARHEAASARRTELLTGA